MNFSVHSFESLAAVDGEGLRYAIFLSGCPLRCACCHNPDTQGAPRGKEYSPEEIVNKVRRYKPYFGERGGVTFSGGEPLTQAEAIASAAPLLKNEGIGYALDTSGCVPINESVKSAVKGSSLVICDLKFYSEKMFLLYTGGNLKDELGFLDYVTREEIPLWIRTVIIPGVNDKEEDILSYADIVRKYNPKRYTLLGFHTLGFQKYEALGLKNRFADKKPMDPDRLSALQKTADEALFIKKAYSP